MATRSARKTDSKKDSEETKQPVGESSSPDALRHGSDAELATASESDIASEKQGDGKGKKGTKKKESASKKKKQTEETTEAQPPEAEKEKIQEEPPKEPERQKSTEEGEKPSKQPDFVEFEISIDKIVLGDHQPRNREGLEARGSLTRLKENIREVGLLQPILVEQQQDGTYLLISGERRWRACMQLGHKKIRAVLPSSRTLKSIEKDGRTLLELALFENVRRKDLTPIEEGRTFQQLLAHLKLKQEELGERLGFDQSYISQRISFLELPQEVQDLIEEGRLNTTQAREIVRLQKMKGSKNKREEAQIHVAKKIDVEKLTFRKAKVLVDELMGEKKERDSSQLTRLGAKKAAYFISMLNEKFDEIELEELKEEEEQEKLQQLVKDLPDLIEKLGQLQQQAEKLIQE